MQENKRDQEENRFLEIPKYPHNSFQILSLIFQLKIWIFQIISVNKIKKKSRFII